jgi:non-specific serine/threonine protein kinase
LLVTSRAALRLRWEQELTLLPLRVPDPVERSDLDVLAATPAVALFLERAQATMPSFALNAGNAQAVAGLCVRLDGLPLAIELAAPIVKIMTPAAILARIQLGWSLPEMASRDAPGRHKSLEAAITWSYELLAPVEQTLFRRLAVFPGSFTTEAMERICADAAETGARMLSRLSSLVEHNLVQPDHSSNEQRFRMLETVREFAHDCLAQDPGANEVNARHAAYFLTLVETAEPQLWGQGERFWLDRLDGEEANLRAAMDRREAGLDYSLTMCAGLWRYWELSGRLSEGRARLESLLGRIEAAGMPPSSQYAAALLGAGYLARDLGDLAGASARLERSLEVAEAAGDQRAIGSALRALAVLAQQQGRGDRASELFEAALDLFRSIDHKLGVGWVLRNLGMLLQARGDFDGAASLYRESLHVLEEIGDDPGIARSIGNLGILARIQGRYAEADEFLCRSLDKLEHASDQRGICLALCSLAVLSVLKGELQAAAARLERCLGLARQIGDADCQSRCLAIAGVLLVQSDAAEEGITLIACAHARLPQIDEDEESLLRTTDTLARTCLEDADYEAAWTRGLATPVPEAVVTALDRCGQIAERDDVAVAAPLPTHSSLSPREREVLQQIAEGKTNREIAGALVISEYTVMRHVSNILRKLNAPSRAAAVSVAGASGLIIWPQPLEHS